MFMTYPLPAVVTHLQPTRIAVERVSGLHVVASAAARWSSSMDTNFFWCSAIVGLSQSLMQASSSRGRLIWFQERLGQQCVWSKEHLEKSYVFSAVTGVFADLMSASALMRRKKVFAFAVRAGCRELASEVGRVSERTRFQRSSTIVRARSRALKTVASKAVSECFCSSGDEVSLSQRESCADFPEVSLQLLDPSAWDLVAIRAFFLKKTFLKHVRPESCSVCRELSAGTLLDPI